MLVDRIKENYNDGILNELDKLLSKSEFSFECLCSINSEKQMEVLKDARDIFNQRYSLRICSICHHSELIRDDWMSSSLCLDCGRIRNNKGKVNELLDRISRR